MADTVIYSYRVAGRTPPTCTHLTYFRGRIEGPPGYPWLIYEQVAKEVKADSPDVVIDFPRAITLNQLKRR